MQPFKTLEEEHLFEEIKPPKSKVDAKIHEIKFKKKIHPLVIRY